MLHLILSVNVLEQVSCISVAILALGIMHELADSYIEYQNLK
jgi:hypothetical protein